MPKTIRQTATIPAKPQDVYDAFMDSKTHGKFTGSPAKISKAVGGAFSVHGGYATGKNVELVPGKKIVQTWCSPDFPKGHETQITLAFSRVPSGTRIAFTHRNVPDKSYKSIKEGWTTYYWTPMKKLFAK